MDNIGLYDWPIPYEVPIDGVGEKYIFISYSHRDADIVYHDLMVLINNGARVWYDKAMHIGQSWIECAKKKIMDSNCVGVLFYISANSLKSSAILQELECAMHKMEIDSNFSYASINLDGRSAYNILRSIDIGEDQFVKFLTAFSKKKLFISRSSDPFNQEHVVPLLNVFRDKHAIDTSKCTIGRTQLFEYVPYEQGVQVAKYRGMDAIVTIPSEVNGKKVLAIGINSFSNNTQLKKVKVPEGIKVIDDFSFSGCSSLESISLPNSLVQLGYETFRECTSLQEIVIPYNVKKIGDYCFYKCHNLYNVVFLSSCALHIEFAAFSECQAMETIVLPETTVYLGPYVFNNCIKLKEIVLPENVSEVGLSAFYNCASLQKVKINAKAFLRNNKWFMRCRELKEIILCAKNIAQYNQDDSWSACKEWLSFKLVAPSNISYESDILSWDVVEMADYYDVSINGNHSKVVRPFMNLANQLEDNNMKIIVVACSYNDSILDSDESIEVSVKATTKIFEIENIDDEVILTHYNGHTPFVEIPENITTIGDNVFYNHEEIRKIDLPSGLIRIGVRAFYHCVNLDELIIPNTVEEIGDEAFCGTRIKELTIPINVKQIGAMSFACCNSLKNIQIMSKDLLVGSKVFYRCINLGKVLFPKGFVELSNGMFRGCTELENLVLPNGLKVIKSGAISYVMRLERITIPKTVEVIESEAFSCSFGLKAIYVDDENEAYYDKDGVLYSKKSNCIEHYPADKGLKEYVVDDSITEIADYAFMDAEHLERIVIGKGVSSIGCAAFERCPNLREVIVQGELDYIKADAFKDCIHLERVVLDSEIVPEIQKGIFDNVSLDFKIFVPSKYMKNYMRIIEWQEYCHLLVEYKEL